MSVTTERRLLFGEVAELYERVRPSYPEQVIDELIANARIDRGGRALEVGAGTGKATRLLAARGIPVLALEPDPEMAAVARRTCASYDRVTVEQLEFEQFDPGGQRFQLLFCAQAWHWISPQSRYRLARATLHRGGLLAAFWNRPRWELSPLRAELLEAYRRAAPEFDPYSDLDPMHPATDSMPDLGDAWQHEVAGAPGFGHARVLAYEWSWTYSTAEYVELLQTHSGHMIRPAAERDGILERVAAAIDRNGGKMPLALATVLCTAIAE